MKAKMRFKRGEWNKITADQKTQFCVAKNLPHRLPKTPPTLHVDATQVFLFGKHTSVPEQADFHQSQVLSNRAVHRSTVDTKQVMFTIKLTNVASVLSAFPTRSITLLIKHTNVFSSMEVLMLA
jgi:hypothetical protein